MTWAAVWAIVQKAWPWVQKNWQGVSASVLALLVLLMVQLWQGAKAQAVAAQAQLATVTEKLKTAEAKGSSSGRVSVKVRPGAPVVGPAGPTGQQPCPEVDVEAFTEAVVANRIEEWEAAVDRGGNGPVAVQVAPGQARGLGALSGALGACGTATGGILPYIGGAYHFPAFGMDLGLDARVAFPWQEGQAGPLFMGGLVFRP